jgi:hypothetical protein
MMEDWWGKPQSRRGKLVTCGMVAAIHAVLLISCRQQRAPGFIGFPDEERLFYLMPPRVAPLAGEGRRPATPLPAVQKRALKATPSLIEHATPAEAAAEGEASVIETTVEVDDNWTESGPGKSASAADIHAYSVSLAGKADAHSRGGKPVALDPEDTPFRRMQSGMAQAAKGGGNSTTIAVSSSGEPITIITRNGKKRCYVKVSTSVAPSAVFDNRGSERSTEVTCPKLEK